MAIYKLQGYDLSNEPSSGSGVPKLDGKMFLSSVHWFISVRWITIAFFIISAIAGTVFSDSFESLGFAVPVLPLFFMAGILLMMNCGFYIFSLKITETENQRITVNLWVQIVLDLIFVTILVYFVGSTDTFIPFIYLIHIALSCIFFPKTRSVIIVCAAALFYISCVILQNSGFLRLESVLISSSGSLTQTPVIRILFALSAVLVWFILWYFISTLSEGVRERDSSLRIANQELKRAEKETTRKVLITTHDLKAPFGGIETNINMLKYLHWEELPDSCRNIIDKIEIRSKTLRERINQILALGNLRTRIDQDIPTAPVNLKTLLDNVVGELADQISERKIELVTDIKDITVQSNEENLVILFSNICSNAVYYTPEYGKIIIRTKSRQNDMEVIISDTGIGIDEEYIDKIFNEYFRTPAGKDFNKMSTGLGLQIVKTITERLGLSLTVESEKDNGTTFTIGIQI